MAIHTFASIYIGTFDVSLKIFEFSSKKSIREIDEVSSRLDLGRDSLVKGSLGYEIVEQLCDVLAEYKQIMEGYHVENYEVYASTVLREISNELFVLDQIHLRTGFDVKVISNSEHRFLSYKSLAGKELFEDTIKNSTAMIDVGGASIQIILLKDGHICNTEHIDVGTIKLRELFYKPGSPEKIYRNQIAEYLNERFEVFRSLYLSDNQIENIIFMNDYGMNFISSIEKKKSANNLIKADKFSKFLSKLQKKTTSEIIEELCLSNDKESLIIPSIMLFKSLTVNLGANNVWIPGVNVNDGIANDYAYRNKLIKDMHDFNEDIISAAIKLSEHYKSYSLHISELRELSGKIFDTLKKTHGLGIRERLLLQVATILHDCGKYISLANSAQCAYDIIMSSEILGLSHSEREMVAHIVLFNSLPLKTYDGVNEKLTRDEYVVVAKLSAILRVSNALDQSHKQKIKNLKFALKNKELVITAEVLEDISLEKALFEDKTAYFESVFSIKPVLKEKKVFM